MIFKLFFPFFFSTVNTVVHQCGLHRCFQLQEQNTPPILAKMIQQFNTHLKISFTRGLTLKSLVSFHHSHLLSLMPLSSHLGCQRLLNYMLLQSYLAGKKRYVLVLAFPVEIRRFTVTGLFSSHSYTWIFFYILELITMVKEGIRLCWFQKSSSKMVKKKKNQKYDIWKTLIITQRNLR